MSRYQGKGRWALMVALMVCSLAAGAVVGQEADKHTPAAQRLTSVGAAGVGHPNGWPEAVPLPDGAQIDGYRCSNRYCTLWFGLMDLDQAMVLKRTFINLLKDSGKWEQLGTPGDKYEAEAYRYIGGTYTLEIRQGAIPNDYHRRYRVSTSLTW